MAEQSNYKYIIHIDGNVNAYRLLSTMMTGSLILRVESPYISWVDHLIESGKHYLMVKSDLSDLLKIIKWCEKHPEKAREIAEAGREFAQMALTREFVSKSVEKIFWSLPLMSDKSRIKTAKQLKMAVRNKTRKIKKKESKKEEKEEKEEKEKKEKKKESVSKPRCPKGQHRNKKTGECEPSK
jgi:hypothetical protein